MQNVGGKQYSGERTYFYRWVRNSQTVSTPGGIPFGRLLCELRDIVKLFYSTIPLYFIVRGGFTVDVGDASPPPTAIFNNALDE